VLCPHYGKCGGCQLQHLSYKEQIELKKNKVSLLFNKIDKIIESPKEIYYRNRMDYVIGKEENKVIIGLKEKGKWWKVVDLKKCVLMSKEADEIKNLFKEFANKKNLSVWDLKKHKGLLRYLIIREGKFTNERMVIINTSNDYLNRGFNSNKKEKLTKEELLKKEEFENLLLEFFDLLKENNIKVNSFIHGVNNTITDVSFSFEINVLKGDSFIKEKLHNFYFLINPNTFFQSNSYTADLMIKEVEKLIQKTLNEKNFETLLDLYSGVGTFSIPFNNLFEKIVAIELNKDSIELYKKNLEINNLNKNKFELINKSVEKSIKNLELKDFLLIVDPPRSGLTPKAIKLIKQLKPKQIIYISCNPETQYRDIKLLGAKIKKVIMVDQFPQTYHVETIALLEF
jgi:tRNA (uracil-5-)-methyltransferase